MSEPGHKQIRALSIVPSSRGFGYVVMETPEVLIDWGVKSAKCRKNESCVEQARGLIRFFRPTVLVLEDHHRRGSRRCARVRQLLENLRRSALEQKVKVRRVSPAQVGRAFAPWDARTKRERAVVLANRFPELAHRLPPIRKPWMPQDHWTPVFEAVALVDTFVDPGKRWSGEDDAR